MKPCSKNRKLIAWLAADALNAGQATALRDHFTHCEGCRGYWEEISNVTQKLKAAPPAFNLEASASFHRRVAERLKSVEPGSVRENFTGWLRGMLLDWRVAVPATAALVIAVIVLVAPPRSPTAAVPVPPTVQATLPSKSGKVLSPTLANYQMVASQSLDKLDELLIQQGSKPLPPVPALDLANTSF